MTAIDTDASAPLAPPFAAMLAPDAPAPGEELLLSLSCSDPQQGDLLIGRDLVLEDADGTERLRAPVVSGDDGAPHVEPVAVLAPVEPGVHDWTARLDPPLDDGPDGHPLRLTVGLHRPAVSLFQLPRGVARGDDFTLRVGIKCPFGCDPAGWEFEILDETGTQRAAGSVGQEPWPGTEGVCHAEVTLKAPDSDGWTDWRVRAVARDTPCGHAAHAVPLRVHVTPPADLRLTVRARDGETGAPVAGLKVVAHPHDAQTDAEGVAVLDLPRGSYRLFVSGRRYFPMRRDVVLDGDTELGVEMEQDRELGEEDLWT